MRSSGVSEPGHELRLLVRERISEMIETP